MVPGFTALVGWLMTLGIIAMIVIQGARRKWEFMNYNTFFLLGMVQFFTLSLVLFSLVNDAKYFENCQPSEAAWNTLSLILPLFVGVYLVCYRIAAKWTWPEKLIPRFDVPVTYTGMLIVIGVMFSGIVLTTLAGFSNLGEVFVIMVRPALSAFAVALCVALIIKQPWNLMFWLMTLGVFGLSVVMATTFQTGRRDVLGVFLAPIWMAYWGWLRYQRIGRQLGVLFMGGFVAVTFLFAYTNMRGEVSTMESANLQTRSNQLMGILTGEVNPFDAKQVMPVLHQDASIYSAYIIQTYPSMYELIPFNGPVFFVTNPVPRMLWEDKPKALGIQMQDQLHAKGNLGVGIIGHGWAEGMLIGVLVYAMFFGFFYRAWDNAIANRANNPYFLAATGASLGHLLALPRGEVSLFLIMWFYGLIANVVVIFITRLLFGPFLSATAPITFGYDDPKNLRSMGVIGEDEMLDEERSVDAADSDWDPEVAQESSAYGDDEFRNRRFGSSGPDAAPAGS